MFPPLFATAAADGFVQNVLGSNPMRLYPFGEAPQDVSKPYAVWQIISGSPYNQLHDTPSVDRWLTQVDVYATNATAARNVAAALRDAFEPVAYVVGWRGESRDRETKNYRVGFDVEWHVQRVSK